MCFGNLKGDAPTGIDPEAKPTRVSSVTDTTEENTPKTSSLPKQRSKGKFGKESGTPQPAKRTDEYELGKEAKQRKQGEKLSNKDQYTDLAPDAGKQRRGMGLGGGDPGSAFGGRVGL